MIVPGLRQFCRSG